MLCFKFKCREMRSYCTIESKNKKGIVTLVKPTTLGLYHTISCQWLLMPSGWTHTHAHICVCVHMYTHKHTRTYMDTNMDTHTDVQTKAISINQAHTLLKPSCTWFKNLPGQKSNSHW